MTIILKKSLGVTWEVYDDEACDVIYANSWDIKWKKSMKDNKKKAVLEAYHEALKENQCKPQYRKSGICFKCKDRRICEIERLILDKDVDKPSKDEKGAITWCPFYRGEN